MPYIPMTQRRNYDAFGRIGLDDPTPDDEIRNIKNPTTLSDSVGATGRNRRRDVAKVEKMLSDAGTLDLKQTDGATGYWGMRTADATKAFQKKQGLKVDGQINKDGPTHKRLRDVRDAAKRREERRGQRPSPEKPKLDWSAPEELDTLERLARDKLEEDAKKKFIDETIKRRREDAIKDAIKEKKPDRPIRGGGAGGGGFKRPGQQRWDYDPFDWLDM